MAKRGNGEGSIYSVRGKDGKVKGYRAAYTVHTAQGMKRCYLSGKRREDVRDKLARALSDRVEGLVSDAGALTVGEYLDRWLKDVKVASLCVAARRVNRGKKDLLVGRECSPE